MNCAVRLDECTNSNNPLKETIISGSNIGELLIWTVDRTPSTDPIFKRGSFGGGKEDGLAFANSIHDIKVAQHGRMRLVCASSTPEGGVCAWDLSAKNGAGPILKFVGHTDDVRCLSWYGVDVNCTDRIGISPLMSACHNGLASMVELLLECAGIDVWIGDHEYCETGLHRAARHGHADCMELLLRFDPTLICAGTSDHSSALHRAVEQEREGPGCVRVALQYGADPNQMNDKGLTPVHIAARLGRYRCVRACVSILNSGLIGMR